MIFRRYQLKKESAHVVSTKHPWIFRSHLSSAASIFKTGDWLELVDSQNTVLGHGIYESEGLIAIRVFNHSEHRPTCDLLRQRMTQALARRVHLRSFTNAFRAIHGENDGFPGIVVDVYDNVGVLQTYVPSVDPLGRWLLGNLAKELKLKTLLWKFPSKRKNQPENSLRLLAGVSLGNIKIFEGKLNLVVNPFTGQKSGAFLDLRGLRKWLTLQKLHGSSVLNLFSYTGTLGLAAEVGGAGFIENVDISKGALEVAKKFHVLSPKKHHFIQADLFEWFHQKTSSDKYDLIIVDPPQMAAEKDQVKTALKKYKYLYKESIKHLAPKGFIVACCCTSRISRPVFRKEVGNMLGSNFDLIRELKPEDDHPVGFPEGDYLKILIFKSKR